tara:strand:- start:780 stop:1187 length:408 start_codon:yes stop_codon:yes gene_type:complete
MENLKNIIDILKKDRDNLSKQRDEQSKKINTLTNQVTEIEKEIEKTTNSLSESETKLNNLDSTIKDTEAGYNKLVLAGENLMKIVSQSVSDIDIKLLEPKNDESKSNTNKQMSYRINSVSTNNNGLELDINNFKK